MPILTVEKPRTLCPAGLHTMTLVDVSIVRMPAFDGNGEVDRLVWRFVSSQQDPDGQYYECPVFSGQAYGNPRAKATWLLDMIRPGITKAEADQLNTDDLLGLKFEASVKHSNSVKDPEKKIAEIQYLRPLGNEGAPDPFAFDDPGSVPAGCEVCGQELTEAEVKASRKRWADTLLCQRHGRERLATERVEAAEKVATGAPVAA